MKESGDVLEEEEDGLEERIKVRIDEDKEGEQGVDVPDNCGRCCL